MTEVLGDYELIDRLGTGGMGTVWRARDTRDGSIVAVKVLHQHLAVDAEYVRRFEREARIAASIESPHVVRVLDSGSDGDSRFLVMEYVAGKTLAQHILEHGRLSIDETVSISMAIAKALDAAHVRSVIHRDISPQNVLLQPDGTVKVTDFGVARDLGATAMTATSMLLGKPQYIAPEVVTGRSAVDIRSDIYALGIVMYQMLTGAVPFNAETPYAVMQAHVSQTPAPLRRVRPDVPPWLLTIVDRCLAKNPRDRFQQPSHLVDVLSSNAPSIVSPVRARRSGVVLLLGTGVLGMAVFSVILAVAFLSRGGETTARGSERSVVVATNVPSFGVTIEPQPAATVPPNEALSPTLVAFADRFSCAEVRGTAYRSETEHQWFLSNCLPPTSVPATRVIATTCRNGPDPLFTACIKDGPTGSPGVSDLSCNPPVIIGSIPEAVPIPITCQVTITGRADSWSWSRDGASQPGTGAVFTWQLVLPAGTESSSVEIAVRVCNQVGCSSASYGFSALRCTRCPNI